MDDGVYMENTTDRSAWDSQRCAYSGVGETSGARELHVDFTECQEVTGKRDPFLYVAMCQGIREPSSDRGYQFTCRLHTYSQISVYCHFS